MERAPLKLGICCGDPTGIGPEIIAKALARELNADDTRYVIFGDPSCIQEWTEDLSLDARVAEPQIPGSESSTRISIKDPVEHPRVESMPQKGPAAAEAALAWLTEGARQCLAGHLDGLVTAPLSKEAVLRTGRRFTGQTEFLSALAGHPPTGMMLLGQDERDRWLRVMLATTHVPIRNLVDALTPDKIQQAVRLAAQACSLLQLPRARIAVCALNPHAGEGGLLGDEELTVIGPVVERLRSEGLDLEGPLSGDTVFHAALHGRYDAVVAMYHDQGLPPLKLVAFDTGVNWTVGLPFVRTSPDHGPAYDIAGRSQANPSSMSAAIRLARRLASSSTLALRT